MRFALHVVTKKKRRSTIGENSLIDDHLFSIDRFFGNLTSSLELATNPRFESVRFLLERLINSLEIDSFYRERNNVSTCFFL